MTILIPFPKPNEAREDALAYWTPAPFVPHPAPNAGNSAQAALDQMYGYFARD